MRNSKLYMYKMKNCIGNITFNYEPKLMSHVYSNFTYLR